MKTLLILVTLLAQMSFAAELRPVPLKKQAIAEYTFGINDSENSDRDAQVYVLRRYTATLYSDRSLKIAETTFNSNNTWGPGAGDQQGDESIVTIKVKKPVFELVFSDISALANAEVVEAHNQIVCMMMPSWIQTTDHLKVAREFDYNTQSFKGELALVDGPHGCWNKDQTHPKNEWDRQTAEVLKRSLKLLSL